MMQFTVLASGSGGNATLVCGAGTRVLLDCGIGVTTLRRQLSARGLTLEDIDAVVITHEHADHIAGAASLLRRRQVPLWMTEGTRLAWTGAPPAAAIQCFDPQRPFAIEGLQIEPYTVPHDAREPCQYVFSDGQARIGILSDAGHVTPWMRARLRACDALLLEFNHDPQMLGHGPYPPALRRRVGGQWGHLSNQQAAELLSALDCSRLQHLVAIHLSQKNNTPAHAARAAAAALGCDPGWIGYASQQDGLGWREVH